MYNNLDFSFSPSLAPAACPPSLFVVLPTHAFSSACFSSPLVCHCFTVKLLNSFIGVSTLVTFLFERHGCVRGVVYVSNVSCNISLLFYRSFELIPVSSGRQISFPLLPPARPVPLRSPLPRRLGLYRRRPGGIVKARHPEERYAVFPKQVL